LRCHGLLLWIGPILFSRASNISRRCLCCRDLDHSFVYAIFKGVNFDNSVGGNSARRGIPGSTFVVASPRRAADHIRPVSQGTPPAHGARRASGRPLALNTQMYGRVQTRGRSLDQNRNCTVVIIAATRTVLCTLLYPSGEDRGVPAACRVPVFKVDRAIRRTLACQSRRRG
jgi:hypothetical protein